MSLFIKGNLKSIIIIKMGCRTSNLKKGVIVATPTEPGAAIKKREAHPNQLKDISEFSLRDCSFIIAQVETVEGYQVGDQSIVSIINELH